MDRRIVLAEDEPNIVESLRFLLGRAGFAVTVCETGDAALEAVEASPPCVLILDVMLPGLDGFEVLEKVRGTPATQNLPVLMLTAKGQRQDRERAMASGADMFIAKPFGNDELVQAVQKLAGPVQTLAGQ